MSKYLKLFNNHTQYETYIQTNGIIRPNVSHCVSEKEMHYNPIQYFYVRSNMKTAENTVKIRYEDGMTVNIMDYLNTLSTYIPPYCGYALIENTNIEDNGVVNPTVTTPLTENPYSFTPQEGKTYAVIQQPVAQNNILYPYAQWLFNTSTNVLKNYYILYYVPKMVSRCGMIINGDEYANDSSDTTKKVKITNKVTFGGTVFQRTNSYFVYFDILNLLKTYKTLEILPFMETADSVNVESYRINTCTVSEEADVTSLKVGDVSSTLTVNPNYPNFITPQSGD